jgi:hypothetical protein
MVAIAGEQLATRSALLASALPLALHGQGHSHSASLVFEHGHVDLVLSHSRSDDHHQEPSSDGDHVFHVASADTAGAHRSCCDVHSPLAVAIDLPFQSRPSAIAFAPVAESHSRSADHLRSVVLLL